MKKFNEGELRAIYYEKVKKPTSYFNRYKEMPECPVAAWRNVNDVPAFSDPLPAWDGHDAPRCFTILDFIDWVDKHNLKSVDRLAYTCNTDPELEFLEAKERVLLEYPPHDLHELPDFSEKFDFFIFNQTIEHLYNPFVALENIYKNIKIGGYVFTSVPTINIPHITPIHFNGYNPMGLALLFLSVGFEVVEMGQWGNYKYINKLFDTHKWPSVNECGISNEEKNVCQCWILAKKSLT
jgi:SAM-dependent methyltransferase